MPDQNMSTLRRSTKVCCILKDFSWLKGKYAKEILLVLHSILARKKYLAIYLFLWPTILDILRKAS